MGTAQGLLRTVSLIGLQLTRPSLPLEGFASFTWRRPGREPGDNNFSVGSASFKLVITEQGLGFFICKMKANLFNSKALKNDLSCVMLLDVSISFSYLALLASKVRRIRVAPFYRHRN